MKERIAQTVIQSGFSEVPSLSSLIWEIVFRTTILPIVIASLEIETEGVFLPSSSNHSLSLRVSRKSTSMNSWLVEIVLTAFQSWITRISVPLPWTTSILVASLDPFPDSFLLWVLEAIFPDKLCVSHRPLYNGLPRPLYSSVHWLFGSVMAVFAAF